MNRSKSFETRPAIHFIHFSTSSGIVTVSPFEANLGQMKRITTNVPW
jgi:hypothetical protein